MSQIDPRFLKAREQARRRHQRKAKGARGFVWMIPVLLVGLAGGGWLAWQAGLLPDMAALREPAEKTPAQTPAEDRVLPEFASRPEGVPVMFSEADPPREDAAPVTRGSIDLPGDPLLLNLGGGGGSAVPARLSRPADLPAARGQGDVLLAQTPLLEPGERLSVSLPTSPEDFAIFQAQRQRMMRSARAPSRPPAIPEAGPLPRPASVAEALALVGAGGVSPRRLGADAQALLPSHVRQRPYSDSFLKLSRATDLAEILQIEGLPPPEAEQVAQRAAQLMQVQDLQAGQVLALRQLRRPDDAGVFAQLALYDGTRYLGALGRGDGGVDAADDAGIDIAADPWLRQDLPALLDGGGSGGQSTASPRVMDALYASALRQGLSPGQVGQVIMLLAQTHKLDQDATPDDRLTLLFSATPGTPDADSATSDLDQILYVGLSSGEETRLRCYIHRPGPDRPPACYGPRRGSGPAASGAGRTAGGSAAPAGATQSLTGGDAVEHLVNRIIQIESAGRADARNPLSTATGLGQFIESTWLRMMRTYRPDLSATLSRAELLALRTDPDISREMVLNLAREGESYLRARGHQITAGRLYLAHFLGMDGAHVALSADPATDLLTLFGPGVINANPFLRGHDAGYVVDWAERRMRGASGRIAVIREPDGLAEFRQVVDALLETL